MSAFVTDPTKLKNTTLLFLIQRHEGKIQKVCLAMKKRGFGTGRWNGVGGKFNVQLDPDIENTARRETLEEIGVTVGPLQKIADLYFTYLANPAWNQHTHVYLCESWSGEPAESEEMMPKWYGVDEIPYPQMWPDDLYWFSEVVKGKSVEGSFTFGEGDTILDKNVVAK